MLGIFKNYVNKRIELLKLEVTERTSDILSVMIVFSIILTIVMLFLFFFSLAIGMLIGTLLDNTGLGILIVSCLYLLLFIGFLLNYKKLKKFVMQKIIEFQLNQENNDKD